MGYNEIQAGAKEIANQLDHIKNINDATNVQQRLSADFVDFVARGDLKGWSQLVNSINGADHKGKGWDIEVNMKNGVPEVFLYDSATGLDVGGHHHFGTQLVVNEGHDSGKRFNPQGESGATPRQNPPIEMR